jgi:hypothetical protein
MGEVSVWGKQATGDVDAGDESGLQNHLPWGLRTPEGERLQMIAIPDCNAANASRRRGNRGKDDQQLWPQRGLDIDQTAV